MEQVATLDPNREQLLACFNALPDEERARLEEEALSLASRLHSESYARLKGSRGPLFEQIRDDVILSYLRERQPLHPNGDSPLGAKV